MTKTLDSPPKLQHSNNRHLHNHDNWDSFHDNQVIESAQVPISGWMEKDNEGYLQSFLFHPKESVKLYCRKMDGTEGYHSKQNKLITQNRHCIFFSHLDSVGGVDIKVEERLFKMWKGKTWRGTREGQNREKMIVVVYVHKNERAKPFTQYNWCIPTKRETGICISGSDLSAALVLCGSSEKVNKPPIALFL